MHLFGNEVVVMDPWRVALDFMMLYAVDHATALEALRVNLEELDEWQLRQWIDHLGELLAEQENPVEVLLDVFSVMDSAPRPDH